jgi:hypothetical protein
MVQYVTAWTARKKPAAEAPAAPRTSTLDSLMKVKESASQRFTGDQPARTAMESQSQSGRLAKQVAPGEQPLTQPNPQVHAPSPEKPAVRSAERRPDSPADSPAEKTEASSVSALLASKRARRKDN